MRFWQTLKQTAKNNLLAGIGMLIGGAAFAQAINVAILPIVTRLYTPSDFSALAIYASTLSIISVAACLRFDIAIPIPEKDEESVNLLALGLTSTIIITSIATAITWLAPNWIIKSLHRPELLPYLWALPLGIFLASSYNCFQYWETRKKRFHKVAQTRIIQATGGGVAQIGMGWLSTGLIGLIIGQIINNGAGTISLLKSFFKNDRNLLATLSTQSLVGAFKKYHRFPKYSTLEALANTAGIQLPIILIAATAHKAEAGFVMLAIRVMQIPISLIGSAVSQAYLSHAPQEWRLGNLGTFTKKILSNLSKIGVGPIIFIGIVSPSLFPIIFGAEWARAGQLVSWMTPWFAIQFVSSPISMVLHIKGKQRSMLLLTLLGLAIRVGAIVLSIFLLPNYSAEAYAVSGFVFYIICFFVFSSSAEIYTRDHITVIKQSLPYITIGITAGALCIALLQLVKAL